MEIFTASRGMIIFITINNTDISEFGLEEENIFYDLALQRNMNIKNSKSIIHIFISYKPKKRNYGNINFNTYYINNWWNS